MDIELLSPWCDRSFFWTRGAGGVLANTMLLQCWPTVYDTGSTLNQHWVSLLHLLAAARLCIVLAGGCVSA